MGAGGRVTINGVDHDVRPLTLLEVRKCRELPEDEADGHAIAWACGILPAEGVAFFQKAKAGDVLRVLEVIHRESGLTEDATFPDPQANDAVNGGAAE